MLWLCSPLIVLSLELYLLELGGKDVEDLFTAVLSPAATQAAPIPQPPAPQLLPVHTQGMSPLEKRCKCGPSVTTHTDSRQKALFCADGRVLISEFPSVTHLPP